MADKDRGSTNRRAFISGAVTAGVAAALGAGAPAQRRANPRIRRPTVQTGPRRQEVTLQSLPELAVSTSTPPGREADDPVTPTPGRAPQPATKGQLLDALERAPGGDGLLERIGAPRGGTGRGGQTFDPGQGSGAAYQTVNDEDLAKAYAGGVTLTPDGNEPPDGIDLHSDPKHMKCCYPMNFFSDRGHVSAAARLDVPILVRGPGRFLTLRFATPGSPDQRMVYALQLFVSNLATATFECAVNNDTPLDWAATSGGTLVALVELGGSGEWPNGRKRSHMLSLAEGTWPPGVNDINLILFKWFRVTAF